MTRDDIIRMAREAGLHLYVNDLTEEPYALIVERFANLVAAAERETCAKLCEKLIVDCCYDGEAKGVAEFLADEIRWRVESEVADMQENELKQGKRNEP
jgi:hypothetical protein